MAKADTHFKGDAASAAPANDNREDAFTDLDEIAAQLADREAAEIAAAFPGETTASLRKKVSKAETTKLGEMNKKHAMIKRAGSTRVMNFHRGGTVDYSTAYDFSTYYRGDTIWTLTTSPSAKFPIKKEPLADWWLSNPGRRRYVRHVFEPKGAVAADEYNLWKGFAIKPKKGDWSLMRAHIKDVIASGNEAWYDYNIKWFAWCMQNPDKPAEAALVYRGPKGAGKGMVGNNFGSLFGEHYWHASKSEDFLGRFNSKMMSTVFLFADEAFWAGDPKLEGELKRIITESTLGVEAKYCDKVEVKNRLHILMASNANWVVPASPDERRYAVFDVSDKHIQDEEYFSAIAKQMANGGREAMLFDLQKMDLGDWHPRWNIPMTPALRSQIERSEGPVEHAFREMLEVGGVPAFWGADLPPNVIITDDFIKTVKAPKKHWVEQEVGDKFKGLGGVRKRYTVRKAKRKWGYVMPSLVECRLKFDRNADWSEEPEDWEQQPSGYTIEDMRADAAD